MGKGKLKGESKAGDGAPLETVGPTDRKLIPRVEPRTKKAPAWGEVKESDVIVEDRNGSPIKIGSIVEIIEIGDSYKGLLYVVGIEAGGGRSTRLLLALGRWDKWDFKASPSRVSLRCYEPVRGKGE